MVTHTTHKAMNPKVTIRITTNKYGELVINHTCGDRQYEPKIIGSRYEYVCHEEINSIVNGYLGNPLIPLKGIHIVFDADSIQWIM